MTQPKLQKIATFLWYNREAVEAARFYTTLFPDSRVDRVSALPTDSPSGPAGSVEVVEFTLFGQPFKAMSAGPHHDFNDAMSLMVSCESAGRAGQVLGRHPRARRQAAGLRLDQRQVRRALADRADRAARP